MVRNPIAFGFTTLLLFFAFSCTRQDDGAPSPGLSILQSVKNNPCGYRYTSLPSQAVEIAAGGSGNAYILSTELEPNGGHKIYYWGWNVEPANGQWTYIPSPGAIAIDGSFNNEPVIVTAQGEIYYSSYNSSSETWTWTQFTTGSPPAATAIASGPFNRLSQPSGLDGLFILGTSYIPGGHPVYRYERSTNTWIQQGTQGAMKITVDAYRSPWIIDDTGKVFKLYWNNTVTNWIPVPVPGGSAKDIQSNAWTSVTITGCPVSSSQYDPCPSGNTFWQDAGPDPTLQGWTSIYGVYGKRASKAGYTIWFIGDDNKLWRNPVTYN